MQKLPGKNKSKELIGMIAAAVLIAAGIFIVAMATNNFGDEIEKNQDAQLESMIASSDRNITDSITRFDGQMVRFTGSEKFREDVAVREEEGGAEQLKKLMQNSAVSNFTTFEAMFLVDNGDIEISTMEGKDYTIGKRLKDNIYSCTDSSDNGYLAFRYEYDDRISCYGILDIKSMYYTSIRQTNAAPDSIMLLEAKTGTLYGQKDGEIVKSPADEDINSMEGHNLRASQDAGSEETITYEKKAGDDERTTRALAVSADNLENGIFAISASSDYDVIEALARGTATKLILGFALVLAGLVIGLLIFLRGRREIIEVDKEL